MCRSSRTFVYTLLVSLTLSSFLHQAQSLTQTVGGKITAQDTCVLVPGVNVAAVGTDVFPCRSTNEQGEVCTGVVAARRTTQKISHVGHEEKALSNLHITSGKEMAPGMELQEFLIGMVGVAITRHQNTAQAGNELALVIAGGLTVEGTKRYAGSFNAMARMVPGDTGLAGAGSDNSKKVLRYLC